MNSILVVVERSRGEIDDSAWELLGLARGLRGSPRVMAALIGRGIGEQAQALGRHFDEVHAFEVPWLEGPDGMLGTELLAPLVEASRPLLILIPHTNTGMDLAPRLAVKVDAPLLADCLSLELGEDGLRALRTLYGGKVNARVATSRAARYLATVRPGAFPRPAEPAEAGGVVRSHPAPAREGRRRRHLDTVAPEAGAVDLSQSERLVAVGRGIGEEENLGLLRSLAEALGAGLASTRPIVDKGWLPKSHQVGTSGVTVKPKLYLAVGVSGSFQHMGGVKGGPFIVAINKDPAAPIFGVANLGIVADLFRIVPLLEKRIRESKS